MEADQRTRIVAVAEAVGMACRCYRMRLLYRGMEKQEAGMGHMKPTNPAGCTVDSELEHRGSTDCLDVMVQMTEDKVGTLGPVALHTHFADYK